MVKCLRFFAIVGFVFIKVLKVELFVKSNEFSMYDVYVNANGNVHVNFDTSVSNGYTKG